MSLAITQMLLAFAWQGALLGLVAWVVDRMLARTDAAIRHGVSFGCLASAPVIAALTLRSAVLDGPAVAGFAIGAASAPTLSSVDIVALLYGIGVLSLSTQTILQLAQIRRLRATGLALRELADSVRAVSERLHLNRAVLIVETIAVDAPVVVGWIRPMILLPIGLATRMDGDALEAVLAHELAHVRRLDPLLAIVQRVIVVFLFFHPVVWWLSARLDATREEACDDLVVDALQAPMTYARALAALEAARHDLPAFALGANDSRCDQGQLMTRIQRITRRAPRRHTSSLTPAAVGLCAAVLVGSVAAAAQTQDPAESKTDAATEQSAAGEEQGVSIAWLPDRVLAYEAEISAAAMRHGVDPNLLAIVVLVESGGQHRARSPMGARGLMQLMPATAKRIADERGLKDHHETRLDDPAYNLDLGSWFLAQQLRRFGRGRSVDDGVSWAAAAYNGGPQRVEQVLRGRASLSEETRHYRARVSSLWAMRHAERDDVPK